jgi:hypothetical protein
VTELSFRSCTLTIDHADRYIETRFLEDGTTAPARPNFRPSDVRRAHELGYRGDCWQMCIDHEVMHNWVAEMAGEPHSRILWNVAHGGGNHWPEGGREEEGYVMAVQTFLRRGRIDDLFFDWLDRSHEATGWNRLDVIDATRAILTRARRG